MLKSNKTRLIVGSLFFVGLIFIAWFCRDFFSTGKSIVDLNEKTEEIIGDMAGQGEQSIAENKVELKNEKTESNNAPEESLSAISVKKEEAIKKENPEQIQPRDVSLLKVVDKLIDFGYQNIASRDIDTIIVHSSYDALGQDKFSVSGIIKEYEEYGVSAHYLISRDGTVYRLVADKNIAYHAGISKVPDGRTGVNNFSIGIELINTKTDKFTEMQYQSLKKLIIQLKNNYKIKYVLGHNQVAPGRKDDPWNFDWKKIN